MEDIEDLTLELGKIQEQLNTLLTRQKDIILTIREITQNQVHGEYYEDSSAPPSPTYTEPADVDVKGRYKEGDRVSFPCTEKTAAGLGVVMRVSEKRLTIRRTSTRGQRGKGTVGELIIRNIQSCHKY